MDNLDDGVVLCSYQPATLFGFKGRIAMEFNDILYTKENGIATITLNRPESLNALSGGMQREWISAIGDAAVDDDVRVLIVTATGRAFCAGGNPKARETTL